MTMPATEQQLQELSLRREEFLCQAAAHAIIWLSANNVGKKCSEIKWLNVFSSPKKISEAHIRAHKNSWSIQGVAGNPYSQIAEQITERIQTPHQVVLSNVKTNAWIACQVDNLAADLGVLAAAKMSPRLNGSARTLTHTSWASKFLLHIWPAAQVFVWDGNARLSLNTRYRGSLSKSPIKGYRYSKFMDECEGDLNFLRSVGTLRRICRELSNAAVRYCSTILDIPNFQKVVLKMQ